jgi:hypothetical protein
MIIFGAFASVMGEFAANSFLSDGCIPPLNVAVPIRKIPPWDFGRPKKTLCDTMPEPALSSHGLSVHYKDLCLANMMA